MASNWCATPWTARSTRPEWRKLERAPDFPDDTNFPMIRKISPASALHGAILLPGDKSISHRYAMIAAIAEGPTRISNYSTGADCHSTLGCVRALGIEVTGEGTE